MVVLLGAWFEIFIITVISISQLEPEFENSVIAESGGLLSHEKPNFSQKQEQCSTTIPRFLTINI
jgi:hypothetical protein